MTVKMTVVKAKALLKRAAGANKNLEDAIKGLVASRAWEIMGYPNFSQMWEIEQGFTCPTSIKITAAVCCMSEGMNNLWGKAASKHGPNGHTHVQVATAIGIHVGQVSAIYTQFNADVPTSQITMRHGDAPARVRSHGVQARGQNRRTGKAADELVQVSFGAPRRDADAMHSWAASEGIPNAEAYRQAVVLFLDKVAPTRARKTQSKR